MVLGSWYCYKICFTSQNVFFFLLCFLQVIMSFYSNKTGPLSLQYYMTVYKYICMHSILTLFLHPSQHLNIDNIIQFMYSIQPVLDTSPLGLARLAFPGFPLLPLGRSQPGGIPRGIPGTPNGGSPGTPLRTIAKCPGTEAWSPLGIARHAGILSNFVMSHERYRLVTGARVTIIVCSVCRVFFPCRWWGRPFLGACKCVGVNARTCT